MGNTYTSDEIQKYENMMSNTPVIRKEYLHDVLHLSVSQNIDKIIIKQVIESNTALTIRFEILIKDNGYSDERRMFFVKTVRSDSKENVYHELSIKEAEFYKMMQNENISNLPIAKCFDAYISEDKTKYLILLQDLSDIFVDSSAPDLADKNTWFSAAECLAEFHAASWNLKNSYVTELQKKSVTSTQTYIDGTYEGFQKFKDYVGDRFDDATYTIYEHAVNINIAMLKERDKRIRYNRNITLVHGDSHIHNFMISPNQTIPPVLIDFQFWGIGLGAGDLGHLTRSLPYELCKSLHKPIVEKYYKRLIEQGVSGYSWDECWNDYKIQVATMLLIPVWQYSSFNLKYDDWINSVQGLIFNYNTLNCSQIEV